MEKKITLASLLVTAIIGSLTVLLSSNMLFSDVGNIGADKSGLIVTFPALMLSALFVLLTFYLIRFYKRPKTLKRLTRFYLIFACALSGVGLITSILAGAVYYGSLVSAHPFPGYVIIMMVLHILVIGGAVFALIKLRKLPEDEEQFKVTPKYVFSTIGWTLFIGLVYNRLGTLFGSPLWIEWRTFYMSFPFFIYLLTPLALGVMKVLDIFGYLENRKKAIIALSCITGAFIVLFVVTAIVAMNETAFISSVSQAMPLERLASMPIESIIHLVSYLAVAGILFYQNIKALRNK